MGAIAIHACHARIAKIEMKLWKKERASTWKKEEKQQQWGRGVYESYSAFTESDRRRPGGSGFPAKTRPTEAARCAAGWRCTLAGCTTRRRDGQSDRAGRMIPTDTYFHGCEASSSGWAGLTIVTSIVLAWLPLFLYEEDS